ncbi:tRNA-pseudouridine synthase [Pluteus cervinus]|uniref:tRNA-pseudouridine synthase n=1 Tax=Pluteus cervinus TaxID=181527 RepID=A0ACD3AJL8_9AGAR|nr:tRNA-pseudouridine synthase [Pluteus cervinus]
MFTSRFWRRFEPARSTIRRPNLSSSSRIHIPLISLSAKEQFRQNIFSLIRTTMTDSDKFSPETPPGLKKIPPYWYPYTTMAKERWLGRELLEVVSTEFRDRSMEYYRYALESGVTTINGKVAKPDTIILNGDRIENVVHRHEPPVTSTPVKVLLHDTERGFIVVDKPGSIPVHASGRYYRNTLVEILVSDFGYEKVYTVNRLDRLTSGLMILPLNADRARELTSEFMAGTVRKEYVARCKGRFPSEEVVCEEPLLTVDRQMGLNVVHPEGKPAKTIFNLIRYDENTDNSIVRCRPLTGRSHQIRVHLQYLGHPIANDPVYSEKKIWGENLGKGGIDLTPTDERSAPAPPPHLISQTEASGSPESLSSPPTGNAEQDLSSGPQKRLLPRETGQDIGMGSPVPLSSEAVGIITRLRNMKDEDEDWSRWRDVVFRAKGALTPRGLVIKPPPGQNQRKRGKAEFVNEEWNLRKAPVWLDGQPTKSKGKGKGKAQINDGEERGEAVSAEPSSSSLAAEFDKSSETSPATPPSEPPQLSTDEVLEKVSTVELSVAPVVETDRVYCPECYLPLHPDPKPEKLFIFLHALKYTTSLGTFQTDMPAWSEEGWTWDQS